MYQVSDLSSSIDELYSRLAQGHQEIYVSFISSLNGLTTDGLHLHVSVGEGGKIMVTGEVVQRIEAVPNKWSWERQTKKVKDIECPAQPIELSAFLYRRLNLDLHVASHYSVDFFLTKVGLDQALGVQRSYHRYTSEMNRLKKKCQKHLDARDSHILELQNVYIKIIKLAGQFPDLQDRRLI